MGNENIGFQVNEAVSYFVNMNSNIFRIIALIFVFMVIFSIVKKALKTALALSLIAVILLAGSWVKTSIIDVNNIKINDTYMSINGQTFEFSELNGFEIDESKSELIVKTASGDMGIYIDSNLDGVNKLLNMIAD